MTTPALHRALEAFPAVSHTVKPDDRTPEYLKQFRAANQIRASLFSDNLIEKIDAYHKAQNLTVPVADLALEQAVFDQHQFDCFSRLRIAAEKDDKVAILTMGLGMIYNTVSFLRAVGFTQETLDRAMNEFHAHRLLVSGVGVVGAETKNPDLTSFVQPATKD